MPWEAAIKFHRYLAWGFMAATTVHMLCWWGVYAWGGKFDPRPFNISDGTNGTAQCTSSSCADPACAEFFANWEAK